jgi:hypothetical protein
MSASPLGAEPGADGLQTCPACIPHRYTPCNANNSTLSSTTAAHALVRLLERQMHPAPISTPTAAASTARHDDWLLCKCKVWCRRPCAACASSMCACAYVPYASFPSSLCHSVPPLSTFCYSCAPYHPADRRLGSHSSRRPYRCCRLPGRGAPAPAPPCRLWWQV